MKTFLLLSLALGVQAMAQEPAEMEPGRRGEWVLAVRDPEQAEASLRDALRRLGGFVSDTEADPDTRRIAARVAVGSFDAMAQFVRSLGKVASESTTTVEPTPMFAALNVRLGALDATERDLREQLSFLAPDEPLAVDIQREIAAIRSERAAVLARRTVLEERVQYAEVLVTLLPEAASRPPTFARQVFGAFASAWTDPAAAAREALVVGAGLLLPFLGLPALAVWLVVRFAPRRRTPDRATDRRP